MQRVSGNEISDHWTCGQYIDVIRVKRHTVNPLAKCTRYKGFVYIFRPKNNEEPVAIVNAKCYDLGNPYENSHAYFGVQQRDLRIACRWVKGWIKSQTKRDSVIMRNFRSVVWKDQSDWNATFETDFWSLGY